MRWRRAIALTILSMLGLWHPGHALASPGATAAEDIPIAEAFWGGPPEQCTSVSFGNSPPLGDGGWATRPYPGYLGPCEMQVREVGTVDPVNGYLYTPEYVCLMTVHEQGHLHGNGHSADPTNIMWGGSPLDPDAVPACKGAAVPNYQLAGPRAGATPAPPPTELNAAQRCGCVIRHRSRRRPLFRRNEDLPVPHA